jgi:hypothetical protein
LAFAHHRNAPDFHPGRSPPPGVSK